MKLTSEENHQSCRYNNCGFTPHENNSWRNRGNERIERTADGSVADGRLV